jgi:hypothetical protein
MSYGILTVGKLKKLLTAIGKEYDGDDTPVYTGDFECNCLHGKHEVMKDDDHRAIFIGYEMHENLYD